MGLELAKAFISVGVDSSKLEPGLNALKNPLTSKLTAMGATAGASMGRALGTALRVGVMGVFAGGAIAAAMGVMSGKMASDAEEIRSKFNTIFKNTTDEAKASVDSLADYLGQASSDVMDSLATLGDTFKPMGFDETEALDMSATLTKLAGDLSSFNNMSTDEALRRLQGGLIGSHENLLKFGVIINEATLKEKILAMGLDTSTEALTNKAKALARLQLIMEGTTDAQGDLARTSDSFANTSRRLGATWKEVMETMGQATLPIMTSLAGLGEAFGSTFQRIIDGELPEVLEYIHGIRDVIDGIAVGVRNVRFSDWREGLSGIMESLSDSFMVIWMNMSPIIIDIFDRAAFRMANALRTAFGLSELTEVIGIPIAKQIKLAMGQTAEDLRRLWWMPPKYTDPGAESATEKPTPKPNSNAPEAEPEAETKPEAKPEEKPSKEMLAAGRYGFPEFADRIQDWALNQDDPETSILDAQLGVQRDILQEIKDLDKDQTKPEDFISPSEAKGLNKPKSDLEPMIPEDEFQRDWHMPGQPRVLEPMIPIMPQAVEPMIPEQPRVLEPMIPEDEYQRDWVLPTPTPTSYFGSSGGNAGEAIAFRESVDPLARILENQERLQTQMNDHLETIANKPVAGLA